MICFFGVRITHAQPFLTYISTNVFNSVTDNVIKIWRVFPFAEEALAPLMSFYCAHTPLHMTVMRTVLCVAFQDPSSATYSIVHYNLNNKSEYA